MEIVNTIFRVRNRHMYFGKDDVLTLAAGGKSEVHGRRIEVVVLYADLRAFSTWSQMATLENVADLLQVQYERAAQMLNDFHPTLMKLLGDGFLLAWEADEEMTWDVNLRHALDAAHEVHNKYFHLVEDLDYDVPAGYGVGISIGDAIKVQPETIIKELNEIDVVGYPMNCGARMQELSGSYGVTLCSNTAARILRDSDAFLYPHEPAFTRVLHDPTPTTLAKARGMNGLSADDQTGFRHLTFGRNQRAMWGTDGIVR